MKTNKCYITAQYKSQHGNFIFVTIGHAEYLLYIGNFKNTEKILAKIERDHFINAICRIRYVYEPEYLQFNPKIVKIIQSYLTNLNNKHLIWLEAIKLTTLPEAKIYSIKEQGYFKLEDIHKNIYPYITGKKQLTSENQEQLVTIHGKLEQSHMLSTYKVLKVEGQLKNNNKVTTDTIKDEIPQELKKFMQF